MDSSSGRHCGRKARRVQYIKKNGKSGKSGLRLCNSANRPTSKFRLPIGGSHHDMTFRFLFTAAAHDFDEFT